MGSLRGALDKARALRSTFETDWGNGIVPISMMGFQGQAVVGAMVGLIQSVYLVQFGARASVLSVYLALALPINFAASCFAVAVLVGISVRYARVLFILGCCTSLVAGLALTFPPSVYSDTDVQAGFLSHYFGILCIIANIGAKFRDYPVGLAKVYLLQSMHARASENAYNKIFDVMVGNGVNGALMLSLLANPTAFVKLCLATLQIISTVISLRGGFILQELQETKPGNSAAHAGSTVLGAQMGERGKEELMSHALESAPPASMVQDGLEHSHLAGAGMVKQTSLRNQMKPAFAEALKLLTNRKVWQLLAIEWCVGFIFTLNSQAAGTIYWSSVVGVSDSVRSMFIGLESALGGGVLGLVTTLYVTRLYHRQANVSIIIPRIVAGGALTGFLLLAVFGTTRAGALSGITVLYLYYFVFAWTNIEFLSLLDMVKAEHLSDDPLLYMYLIKDIAGGLFSNLRNMILMWLLAETGFYEPDCKAQCAFLGAPPDCEAECHASSHASITRATVLLVRVLYVLVTPGAYFLACLLMRTYAFRDDRRCH